MELSITSLAQIEELAAERYTLKHIAIMLNLGARDTKRFFALATTPGTEVNLHYIRGQQAAELEIDKKLQENAEDGDIDSAKLIRERNQQNKLDTLKHELFGI